MNEDSENGNGTLFNKVVLAIFSAQKYLKDPQPFQKMSLIPIMAWIGLGSDGLSPSAEAFRALGEHSYLAVFLGLVTALKIFIISYAYSRIIEHFPHKTQWLYCRYTHAGSKLTDLLGIDAFFQTPATFVIAYGQRNSARMKIRNTLYDQNAFCFIKITSHVDL